MLKDKAFQSLYVYIFLIKVKPALIYWVSSEAWEGWGRLRNELFPLQCTDSTKID